MTIRGGFLPHPTWPSRSLGRAPQGCRPQAVHQAELNSVFTYTCTKAGLKEQLQSWLGDSQGCKVLQTPVGKFCQFPRRPLELVMSPPGRCRLGVSILQRNKGALGALSSWGARPATPGRTRRMVGRRTAPTGRNQPLAVSRGKRTQATAAPCRNHRGS